MAVPDAYRGREQTYIKHTLLTKYLDRLGHKVLSQWDSINYVDCFAGPWQSAEPDYRDTSFGIAFHVLSKCQENLSLIGKKLRLRFCFVESDPQSFEELSAFAASKRTDKIEIVVLKGEFEENLPQIRQFLSKAKGLPFRFLLIDPKGWTGFALKKVAPLVEDRSAEILVTMMTYHIRRFVSQEEHATQFNELFADETVVREASSHHGTAREQFLVKRYAENLKRLARFTYTTTAAVFRAAEDTLHYYLIFGTNSPHGVVVFKAAEQLAFETGESARGEAKKRKRPDLSGQVEFDALTEGLQASSEIARTLRRTYRDEARQKLGALLQQQKSIKYDDLLCLTLETPLVWEADVEKWVNDLIGAGRVTVDPALGRKRLRVSSGFVIKPTR